MLVESPISVSLWQNSLLGPLGEKLATNQTGFAALQNGFAALQNGFAALQNGFADLLCRIANRLSDKVN